jgi:hypothetical protein
MHIFDAPMHGKHINIRDFSSSSKYAHSIHEQDTAVDDCQGGVHQKSRLWAVLSVFGASAMTLVYGQSVDASDWGPEAGLMHFFLAAFLPLRIYGRLSFPDKTHVVWPSLALHATVMLCAYPYERERVSVVLFCGVLLCVGFYGSLVVSLRSLAVNAATLLVILNAVLCLMVYASDSRLATPYYHASFFLLLILLLSF